MIHAGKFEDEFGRELWRAEFLKGFNHHLPGLGYWSSLDFGAIIGCVEIVECLKNHEYGAVKDWGDQTEYRLGDWSIGRYIWKLANPFVFSSPIECRGAQKIWPLPADVAEKIKLPKYYRESLCYS